MLQLKCYTNNLITVFVYIISNLRMLEETICTMLFWKVNMKCHLNTFQICYLTVNLRKCELLHSF